MNPLILIFPILFPIILTVHDSESYLEYPEEDDDEFFDTQDTLDHIFFEDSDNDEYQIEVNVLIRGDGLDLLRDTVEKVLHKKFNTIRVSDKIIPKYGVIIHATNITIRHLDFSDIWLNLHPPNGVMVYVRVRDFQACGKWSIEKLKANGDICTGPQTEKSEKDGEKTNKISDIDLLIIPNITNDGRIQMRISSCHAKLPLKVTNFSGGFQSIVDNNLGRRIIAKKIQERVSESLCKRLEARIGKALQRIPEVIKLTDHYGLQYRFQELDITNAGITAKMAGSVVDINLDEE